MAALIAMRTSIVSRQPSVCIDTTPFPPSQRKRKRSFWQSFARSGDPSAVRPNLRPSASRIVFGILASHSVRGKSLLSPSEGSCIMQKNMGIIDRTARILFAVIIAVLYFNGLLSGTLAILLGFFAIVFLLTSFVGFCPLYAVFKISTGNSRTGTKKEVTR